MFFFFLYFWIQTDIDVIKGISLTWISVLNIWLR